MAQSSGTQPGTGPSSGASQSSAGQPSPGQSGTAASSESSSGSSAWSSIPESRSGSGSERVESSGRPEGSPGNSPENSQGRTTIAAAVVQKIAGLAGREIDGVHAMGGGVSRTFGAIKERIPGGGTSSTSGVQVEVGEKEAAVDLDMIVEYGVSIPDLARAVRRNVVNGVERMTGLHVIEVNIAVDDVHLPSEDDGESREPGSTPRVQ